MEDISDNERFDIKFQSIGMYKEVNSYTRATTVSQHPSVVYLYLILVSTVFCDILDLVNNWPNSPPSRKGEK